jgi:hypothetical protein
MHDYVIKWYQQADTKAQVILGFTGVFLSILVGAFVSGFVKYNAQQTTWLREFPQGLFWSAVACHLFAVIFSAIALWSRGVFRGKKTGVVFFGHIANHSDANDFRKAVCSDLTQEDYQNELAMNVYNLARNTRIKHRFVDAAVISSGLALLTTVWLLAALLLKTS